MTNKKSAKPQDVKVPPAVQGRPTKFTDETIQSILFLAAKGCTDQEIADFLKIDRVTLHRWKTSKDFCNTLKDTRAEVDALVRQALLSRALGYEYTEDFATKDGPVSCQRVLHPDVTACIFWLKNRRPKEWRGNGEHEEEGKTQKSLYQLFLSVREKEQGLIRAGKDQLEVLFGDEFVKAHHTKKQQNADTPAKSRRRV